MILNYIILLVIRIHESQELGLIHRITDLINYNTY